MTVWSEASRGFSGQITDFPLTSVLQILELGRKTGFLYVRAFPKVAFLVFRDGGIIQAVSSFRRVGLGELLLSEGLIHKEDLTRALDTQKRAPGKVMLGEIFETLGYATHQQIVEVLTKQMKEIVRWVLEWNQGEFTFYAEGEPKPRELSREEEEMVLPVGIVVQEVLKSMLQDKDRRRHIRVPVSMKVVWKWKGQSHALYTRDVSGGGVFILSDLLPEKGDVVEFTLWVPTLLEPVPVRARAVRIEKPLDGDLGGFAVEFEQIEDEAKNILARLGGTLGSLF